MLSVSVSFICPSCQGPGDPVAIFSLPGGYIVMLGCMIGTRLVRAFLLPISSMLLAPISHHITLCGLVFCWSHSPELLPPASLSGHSQECKEPASRTDILSLLVKWKISMWGMNSNWVF